MDATRAEVEKQLRRIQGCIESVRFKMEQHKEEIRTLTAKNFDACKVANMAEWVRQEEQEERLYRYAERILQGILDRTEAASRGQ